ASPNAQVGKSKAATDGSRTALEIRERLVRLDRKSPQRRRELALSYAELAQRYAKEGDFGESLSLHEKALELQTSLLDDPAARRWAFTTLNSRWQLHSDLARSHQQIGMILTEHGDRNSAIVHLQACDKLITTVRADVPKDFT